VIVGTLDGRIIQIIMTSEFMLVSLAGFLNGVLSMLSYAELMT